jgi:hypothetical protein
MTTESAREEAFRLGEESGLLAAIRDEWDYMEEATIPVGSMAAIERLIALARQRPGWVWVPEDATQAMCEAVFDVRPSLANAVWHQMVRAAPKPEEGK